MNAEYELDFLFKMISVQSEMKSILSMRIKRENKRKNLKFSSIQMRRYSYADNNFYCISFAYVYIFLPPLSFNFNWTNAQKCGNETRAIRLIWSICLYFRLIDVVDTRLDIVNSFTSHEKQQFGREKNDLGFTKYDSIRKLFPIICTD